jgi:hypothetical protein
MNGGGNSSTPTGGWYLMVKDFQDMTTNEAAIVDRD